MRSKPLVQVDVNDVRALNNQPLLKSTTVPESFGRELSLSASLPVNDAIQCIVNTCLLQILSNLTGITGDWNSESLHLMRVGLRRLRSALWLFKDIQPLPNELKQEMKWLDCQLGPARDWDVFVESSLQQAKQLVQEKSADEKRLKKLIALANDKVTIAHANVKAVVTSARFSQLILCLLRWQCELHLPPHRHQNKLLLITFADKVLKKNQRRLIKRSREINDLHPASLHRLRIIIKKMRYSTDFFKELYPSKQMRQYIKSMTHLQEILGASNDVTVANRLLNELHAEHPGLQSKTGFFKELHTTRFDAHKMHIPELLKKIMAAEYSLLIARHRHR